jgi:hypothetical protein
MPADREALSLTAVPADLLLRLLRQAGSHLATRATLDADRAAGAPIAEDGTVNVVAYAAWLARSLAHGP